MQVSKGTIGMMAAQMHQGKRVRFFEWQHEQNYQGYAIVDGILKEADYAPKVGNVPFVVIDIGPRQVITLLENLVDLV